LGHNFLPNNVYANIQVAIDACRKDLDIGLFALIVPEGNSFRDSYKIRVKTCKIGLKRAFYR